MCVGITPPCSKCGAPARWKSMKSAGNEATRRISLIAKFVSDLNDDCPIKQELTDLVNGRSSGGE